MQRSFTSRSGALALGAAAAAFAAGCCFIPLAGVEYDEALFGVAIYRPGDALAAFHIHHKAFPTMLMSYLGTLKAWLYKPLLALFGANVATLRVPVALAVAASIWLFYLMLRRAAGTRAAVAGSLLLASDALYVLSGVYDWGPVALQHVLMLGGCLLLLQFYQQGSERRLVWGGILLGLAMWDKALAIWMLGGIAVALAVVYPKQIWRVTTSRRLGVFVLALLIGAFPLVVYNAKHRMATFRGNTSYTTAELGQKARVLVATLDGSGFFGWLSPEASQTPNPAPLQGTLATASAQVSALAGHPQSSLTIYALALALLLAPWAGGRERRMILFAVAAMVVAWAQMALNANTGGSVHHTILLWPLPQLVIAVSFAGVTGRMGRAAIPALGTVLAVLVASGALVLNEYYLSLVRYGTMPAWSDAVFSLSHRYQGFGSGRIYCADWGIAENLRLLTAGRVDIADLPEDAAAGVAEVRANPSARLVVHTPPNEMFPRNGAIRQAAIQAGMTPEAIIADRLGRPVYEVYRPAASRP